MNSEGVIERLSFGPYFDKFILAEMSSMSQFFKVLYSSNSSRNSSYIASSFVTDNGKSSRLVDMVIVMEAFKCCKAFFGFDANLFNVLVAL